MLLDVDAVFHQLPSYLYDKTTCSEVVRHICIENEKYICGSNDRRIQTHMAFYYLHRRFCRFGKLKVCVPREWYAVGGSTCQFRRTEHCLTQCSDSISILLEFT